MPVTVIFGGRFACYSGCILLERIVYVGIDRFAITLQLPCSRHCDGIPCVGIEIILVEVGRALSRVGRPLESPLAVQGYDFFAIGFLRRQCQCGMIRLFVDADYNRILSVLNFLGAGI